MQPNNNIPPVTPTQYPTQPQPSFPQLPGDQNPRKNHTALIVVLASIFVVVIISVITIVLVSAGKVSLTGYNSDIKTDGNDQGSNSTSYSSMEQVNSVISEKKYFSMSFPKLSCGPADTLYSTDRQQWASKWVDCLNSSWESELEDTVGVSAASPELKLVQSVDEVEDCSKGLQTDAAGVYCSANTTIYMIESGMSGVVENDLAVLFHEYAHFLQSEDWVNIDAKSLTAFVYMDYPNQPISQTEATTMQETRIEVNAECTSLGMMNMADRLESSSGKQWLQWFENPSEKFVSGGYGSKTVRSKFVPDMTNGSPSMQACNTWKLSDSDLK